MTQEEKQARLDTIKNAPRKVKLAGTIAVLLGLCIFIRLVTNASVTHFPLWKASLYGLMLFSWYLFASASLYSRSRLGFAALLVLSLLPLFGIFALAIHLLRLVLEGTLAPTLPEILQWLLTLVQFTLTIFMLRYLLAKETRDYVLKPKTP